MDAAALAAITEETEAEDLQALVAAKTSAREAMAANPSADNIAAFRQAKKALAEFLRGEGEGDRVFRNRIEALEHLQSQGYAIEKSKLYADSKAGRLRLQPDKSVSLRDLERYVKAINLEKPAAKAAEDVSPILAEKQRHEAGLAREMERERKRKNDLADGLLMPREQVHMELAGRAVAFEAGIKNAISMKLPGILEEVEAVADRTERSALAVRRVHELVDEQLNEFSQIRSFLAVIQESEEFEPEEETEGNAI